MPSPNKSNKIVSKSSVSKAASGKSKPGAEKGKKIVTTSAKAAQDKLKSAAKNAASPVKSSKLGSSAPAAKASEKNKSASIGSKASVNDAKAQKEKAVSAKAGAVVSKSVAVKPSAAKSAPAKSSRPASAAPVIEKSARQTIAATVAVKADAKQAGKVTSAEKVVAGSKNNQSAASKNPIVTNKTKATTVPPAATGNTKAAAEKSATPVVKKDEIKTASAKTSLAKAAKPAAAPKVEAKAAPAPKAKSAEAAMPAPAAKVAPAAKSEAVAKPAAAPAKAEAPVAAKPAAPVAVKPVAPASAAPVVNNGVRTHAPYRPAVAPAMARPVTKPGVPHAGFKAGEFIVYPAHGVGQIVAIEEQEVAGFKLELFVVDFVKDKMTLKVPMPKVLAGAIRKLSSPEAVKKALDTLTGRARVKRTMWSRRAQEYEAKINSGDLVTIAEVVRDLYRSDAQPEQSYSERQLYEAAVDRMAREVAAVQKLTESESFKVIEQHLQRGPRRGAKSELEVVGDEGANEGEGVVDEAA